MIMGAHNGWHWCRALLVRFRCSWVLWRARKEKHARQRLIPFHRRLHWQLVISEYSYKKHNVFIMGQQPKPSCCSQCCFASVGSNSNAIFIYNDSQCFSYRKQGKQHLTKPSDNGHKLRAFVLHADVQISYKYSKRGCMSLQKHSTKHYNCTEASGKWICICTVPVMSGLICFASKMSFISVYQDAVSSDFGPPHTKSQPHGCHLIPNQRVWWRINL